MSKNSKDSNYVSRIGKKKVVAIENAKSISEKSSFYKLFENSVLDDQLAQSGDRIVNKILFYISKVPIQFSIFKLSSKFYDLLTYNRFEDYLENCFESTD